jgi:ABC-type uncharacterized transport system substrate-binding protein
MKVIGILDSATPESRGEELTAFYRGLRKAGVEGKDIIVQYSWANNDYQLLPQLAAELVRRGVDVIVAAGGPISALEAKKATSRIPIVFTTVVDPIKTGLVGSLKPDGNLTGTAGSTSELDPKRLAMLAQFKPAPEVIGVLVNPNRPNVAQQMQKLRDAAKRLNLRLVEQNPATAKDIPGAFKAFAKQRVEALLVTADPFFNSERKQIVDLAEKNGLPSIYQWPGFVEVGGLMSYGPSKAAAYERAGEYAGKILNDTPVANLPVTQDKKFGTYINRDVEKRFKRKIPPALRKDAKIIG